MVMIQSIWIVHVTFGSIIAAREQYPHKIGCEYRVGGPENNHCPFVDSSAWNCLDCGKGEKVYHCAKNKTGGWTEVCAVVQICKKGQEPEVTKELNIVCTFCQDRERYNPEDSTPSNKMSGCPMEKTELKDHKIECEDSYDKNDNNSVHWMNRRTRCDLDADYIPYFYDERRDTWTCSQTDLRCRYAPCENTSDGIKQKRGIGYRCYPIEGNITPSTEMLVFFNRSETYPRTIETTTVTTNSAVVTPFTATEGDKARDEKQLVGIVVGVIVEVLVVVIAVVAACICLRKWSKDNAKAKKAMPLGPLEVKDIKYRELKLSWNAPEMPYVRSNTEPFVTNYIIEKRQKNQRGWTSVASYQTEVTSISYQVSGLEPNTAYEFRVKAKLRGKLSLPLTTTGKTNYLTVPGMPQGPLSIIKVTTTSITLSWEPPDDDGGAPITHYSVKYRSASDNRWSEGEDLEGDITIWEQKHLDQGMAYIFQVTARNELGESRALMCDNLLSPLCNESSVTQRPLLKQTPSLISGCFKRVININLSTLKEDMDPVVTLDCIKRKNIGTETQYSYIEATTDRCEKNERILKLIQMKGFEVYELFKTILRETKQYNLLNALERTETDIVNKAVQEQNDSDEELEMSNIEVQPQHRQHEALDEQIRARENEELLVSETAV